MSITLVGLIILGIFILVVGAIVFSLIGAYVKALFNGAPVPMSKLVALKFASIPYGLIVDARITAVRAGINVDADQIASHYQAGGNVVPTKPLPDPIPLKIQFPISNPLPPHASQDPVS